MPTVAEAMSAALSHHQAGRLAEAEQLYRQILAVEANNVGAWYFLGVMAHQLGRHDVAVECISRAVALKPDYIEAHLSLGVAPG